MLPDDITTCDSIKRLSIIYKKQNRLNEAIKLCDIGIRYRFDDDTKRGYQARKEKFTKKLGSCR